MFVVTLQSAPQDICDSPRLNEFQRVHCRVYGLIEMLPTLVRWSRREYPVQERSIGQHCREGDRLGIAQHLSVGFGELKLPDPGLCDVFGEALTNTTTVHHHYASYDDPLRYENAPECPLGSKELRHS